MSDEWCTPRWLTEVLGEWDLDPCSHILSTVQALRTCRLDLEQDGLAADWTGESVWCNPPYSRPLPWAERLLVHDAPWCALVKLDPTTRWWATLMDSGATWAPFRRRLRFECGSQRSDVANFASALVWSRWQPSRELAAHLWLPTYARAS